MANLSETATYDAAIYQVERSDLWDAGTGGNGVANAQAKALANRTKYLKSRTDLLDPLLTKHRVTTIVASQTVSSGVNALATGCTYTTPNDGVTRKYLLFGQATVAGMTEGSLNFADVKIYTLAGNVQHENSRVNKNNNTAYVHAYLGSVAPNTELELRLFTQGTAVDFTNIRWTMIEL